MDKAKYFDGEGNECTLVQMLKREPEWLLSRFAHMEAQNAALKECLNHAEAERDDSYRVEKLNEMLKVEQEKNAELKDKLNDIPDCAECIAIEKDISANLEHENTQLKEKLAKVEAKARVLADALTGGKMFFQPSRKCKEGRIAVALKWAEQQVEKES